MADDQYGPFQPMVDKVRGAYKSANDFMDKIMPSKLSGADRYEADPGMVQEANKSFIHPTQTKAQKRPSVAAKVQMKVPTKSGPTKGIAGGK